MPAQVIYRGPTPPLGQKWCFVCAYTWKNAVNEKHKDQIDLAGLAEDTETVVIDAAEDPDTPPLEVAVATGLNGLLAQFGVLDLCWSHLNGIQLQTASGLHLPPPGGGMPGGMPNGRGPFG